MPWVLIDTESDMKTNEYLKKHVNNANTVAGKKIPKLLRLHLIGRISLFSCLDIFDESYSVRGKT